MISFSKHSEFIVREENKKDYTHVESLFDKFFGEDRQERSVYHFRKGPPINSLCMLIEDDTNFKNKNLSNQILACIRFWPIYFGSIKGLLLGPLAVRKDVQGLGYGTVLINKSLSKASIDNWPFCFVSGEADFYPKFGFQKLNLKDIVFNYPIDPDRLHIKYLNSKAKEILGNPPWVVKEYIKNNLFC